MVGIMSLKLAKFFVCPWKVLDFFHGSPWIFVKAPWIMQPVWVKKHCFTNKKVWKHSFTQICDCLSCYFMSYCGEIKVLKKWFLSLKSPWILYEPCAYLAEKPDTGDIIGECYCYRRTLLLLLTSSSCPTLLLLASPLHPTASLCEMWLFLSCSWQWCGNM